jgi:conjugal transfer/type IV secretion protein DotA/TraY
MSIFGSKKPVDPAEANKRSLAGFLFRPYFGDSIKPIGQSMNMFVRFIALLFAMNGMFPKNHPALIDVPGARLSMREVLSTAYRGLSYTRDGMPQVFLFFATVGSMICAGLAILSLVFSIGTAHADTGTCGSNVGIFESCQGTKDLGIQWLDYLFYSKNITFNNYDDTTPASAVATSTYLQTGLHAALSFFSHAVLVIAGIILMYHLLTMIVETAQTGKPMGNANQIWAPIRLVLCLGLLIPVSSTGLNVAQAGTIQIAKWGCGLASHAWTVFLDAMNSDKGLISDPIKPDVEKIVHDVVMLKACKKISALEAQEEAHSQFNNFKLDTRQSTYKISDKASAIDSFFGTEENPALCGKYTIKSAPTGSNTVVSAIYANYKKTIVSMIGDTNDIDTLAQKAECFSPSGKDQNGCPPKSSDLRDELRALFPTYQKLFAADIADALTGNNVLSLVSGLQDKLKSDGWVSAGAYFHIIATLQQSVSSAATAAMPETSPPDFQGMSSTDAREKPDGWWQKVKDFFSDDPIYKGLEGALRAFNHDIIGASQNASGLSGKENKDEVRRPDDSNTNVVADVILGIVDYRAQKAGVWGENSILPLTSAAPLPELAMRGINFFSYGFGMMMWSLAGQAVGAATSGSLAALSNLGTGWTVASSIGIFASTIFSLWLIPLMYIGMILAMAGFTLGFVLPLIPYILFFFAVLTWLITVFEAIVSMPLFALAHLTPKGDGLPGPMAMRGYFFLLSILLRPVLTVFGLIAGLLLFNVSIVFLNRTFMFAAANSISAPGLGTILKIVEAVIYTVLAYICANTAFKAITHFPEHALNWMGQQGPQTKDLHDPGKFASSMGMMAGYMGGQQLMNVGQSMGNQAGQLGSTLGKGLSKRGEDNKAKKEDNQQKKLAGMIDGDPDFKSKANAITSDSNLSDTAKEAQMDNLIDSTIKGKSETDPSFKGMLEKGGYGAQKQRKAGIKSQLMGDAKANFSSPKAEPAAPAPAAPAPEPKYEGTSAYSAGKAEEVANQGNFSKTSSGLFMPSGGSGDSPASGSRGKVRFDSRGNILKDE